MKTIIKKLALMASGAVALLGMSSPALAGLNKQVSFEGIKETTPLYLKMFPGDASKIQDSKADMLLSWHSSHQSHSSHYSHGSHQSHRSHYSSRW